MSKGLLKFVRNGNINTVKWDNCIQNAANGSVYALAWYLDIVAEKWDALVWGNYEYVMPLPFRNKFGLKYFYQPTFCQQLGIFPAAPKQIQEVFSRQLQKSSHFIQISTNAQVNIDSFKAFEINEKTNLVLNLNSSYENLKAAYSKNSRRNISKAKKHRVVVLKGLNPFDFIKNKKQEVKGKVENETFSTLNKIISRASSDGSGFIYAAYNKYNTLCAGVFFLRSGNKIIYLNAFSTGEGKKNSAMFLIIDQFIREHCNTNIILDFEGSSIEGVARFYKGFGAINEPYLHLYNNRIPFPFNLLKKNDT